MPTRGPIISIDDASDDRLVDYRNLNDSVVSRRMEAEGALFVVEGRVAVGRLLRSAYRVQSLLVDDHQLTLAAPLVDGVQARGAPVYAAPRQVLAGIIGFDLHRGVVALAHRPAPLDPSVVMDRARNQVPPGMLAVLENLNDHENIGSLFRNAAAFGVAGLLLSPSCADPLYRRSIRVSVGHVLHVPHARATEWPAALPELREAGFLVVALVPHAASVANSAGRSISLTQLTERLAQRPQPVALVLGAEGPGLSTAAMEESDLSVTIPMAAGVDSLNVATAAAIAFHRIAELRTK